MAAATFVQQKQQLKKIFLSFADLFTLLLLLLRNQIKLSLLRDV